MLRWSLADGGDPYALAAERVARFDQAPLEDVRASVPPFIGGAVGFFGYDLVRTVEPLGEPPGGSEADPLGLPDMALMLSDALVVFDHLKHTVTIIANADLQAEPDIERAYEQAARTIGEVRDALAGPVPRGETAGAEDVPAREAPAFRVEHAARALRSDGRTDRRVHLRGRRFPGGAVAALVGARAGAMRSRSTAACAR